MRKNCPASLFAVATAFLIGSLSAHCAQPARAPTAFASEPCPPPPCASSAPRPASLAASASARIEAAKKLRPIVEQQRRVGLASLAALNAVDELEFRAVRDSGVVGPELVAAATRHLAAMREALELTKRRIGSGQLNADEVARVEYAVAEAEYWLEESKTR
jgi:hypothetical protein